MERIEPGSLGPEREPPDSARRGTNQAEMRAQNERLVLTLARQHGGLSKARIAQITGLSAQTVSVIVRRLEADGLLIRGEKQRGRVGQPSVPLLLNPDGAYFIGVKIGRRSLDVALVDFVGEVRRAQSGRYAYPMPEEIVARVLEEVAEIRAELGEEAAGRIAGIGVAMPFRLWNWAEEIGAPAADMDAWRWIDVRQRIADALPFPAYIRNDATAACGAELAFGRNALARDFVYFFVGTIIGGGVVLNGGLYSGRTGNAASLSGLLAPGPDGRPVRLMDLASLITLERRLTAAGMPTDALQDAEADWSRFGTILDEWIDAAGYGLAYGIAAASEVIDFEMAIIDGALPELVKARLLERVTAQLARLDFPGIDPPQVGLGSLGARARAIGGASLPLFDRFLIDQNAEAGARFSMTEAGPTVG